MLSVFKRLSFHKGEMQTLQKENTATIDSKREQSLADGGNRRKVCRPDARQHGPEGASHLQELQEAREERSLERAQPG